MRYIAIMDGTVSNGFERASDAASFANRHVATIDQEATIAQLKAGDTVLIRAACPRVILKAA